MPNPLAALVIEGQSTQPKQLAFEVEAENIIGRKLGDDLLYRR